MKVPAPPLSYAMEAMDKFVHLRESETLNGDAVYVAGHRLGDSRLMLKVMVEAIEDALAERLTLDL